MENKINQYINDLKDTYGTSQKIVQYDNTVENGLDQYDVSSGNQENPIKKSNYSFETDFEVFEANDAVGPIMEMDKGY